MENPQRCRPATNQSLRASKKTKPCNQDRAILETSEVVQHESDHRNEEAITAVSRHTSMPGGGEGMLDSRGPASTQVLLPNHEDDLSHEQEDKHDQEELPRMRSKPAVQSAADTSPTTPITFIARATTSQGAWQAKGRQDFMVGQHMRRELHRQTHRS